MATELEIRQAFEIERLQAERDALAAQVVQMREALEATDDIRPSTAEQCIQLRDKTIALNTKPAEQIVKGIEARALRKAAAEFHANAAYDLRHMADELEDRLPAVAWNELLEGCGQLEK